MKLHINEGSKRLSGADYARLIRKYREKIVDELIELGKDAYGRYERDLYIYPDGSIEVFDNIGGNSYENNDHFVIWTTRGYEYASPTDNIYAEDLYEIFCDYTDRDKAESYFNRLLDEYECADIERLAGEVDIEDEMQKCDETAYNEMIADILDDEFDSNWANEMVILAIENAEARDY